MEDMDPENLGANLQIGNGEAAEKKKAAARELLDKTLAEAFSTSAYYFGFQGCVFAAFYGTPSQVKCNHKFLPFSLSALAGSASLIWVTYLAFKSFEMLRGLRALEAQNPPAAAPPPPPPDGVNNSNQAVVVAAEAPLHWDNRMLIIISCIVIMVAFLITIHVGIFKYSCWGTAPAPSSRR